jgi:AraC family transcriptional regulator
MIEPNRYDLGRAQMTCLSQPNADQVDRVQISATISFLIESAAASFETDKDASREFLKRACALLRATRRAERRSKDSLEPRPTANGLAPWQVNRVVAYIDSHLATQIRAVDLAKHIGLSTGQFFRAFKLSVGIPPFEYIRQRRIALARELLKRTSEPMSQVAIASGLCDQSHLCRVFRRTFGQSPGAWRRANAVDWEQLR